MIYGVFSDVHSNHEALSVVLSYLEDLGVNGWICCGDLVGYGPDPDACLDRIRALKNLSIICGNHDLAVIDRLDHEWFNQYARAAVVWTSSHLSGSNRAYLEGLTARLETPDFTLAHGTPRNPLEEYLMSPLQFRDNVPLVNRWPLFVGHSHMPLLFRCVDGDGDGDKVDFRFMDDKEEILPRICGRRHGACRVEPRLGRPAARSG